MITLHKYEPSNIDQMISLFYQTVHSINAKDYTTVQLNAWAAYDERSVREKIWKNAFSQNITYIAKISDKIVGFSDMTSSGYLDRLFVDKDFQNRGIATLLLKAIEQEAIKLKLLQIDTESSITAINFFERRGFQVIKEQTIICKNIALRNYKMTKNLVLNTYK